MDITYLTYLVTQAESSSRNALVNLHNEILDFIITSQLQKEIRFLVTTGGGWGQGELDEGGQKPQTSSYKIKKVLGM